MHDTVINCIIPCDLFHGNLPHSIHSMIGAVEMNEGCVLKEAVVYTNIASFVAEVGGCPVNEAEELQ